MAGKKHQKHNQKHNEIAGGDAASGDAAARPAKKSCFIRRLSDKRRALMMVPVTRDNHERRRIVERMQPKLLRLAGAIGELLTVNDIMMILADEKRRGGFTVAIARNAAGELVFAIAGFPATMSGTEFKPSAGTAGVSPQDILDNARKWFEDIRVLLEHAKDHGYIGVCFGGWFDPDKGEYEINISLLFRRRKDAERFSVAHDQIATFDIARGKPLLTCGRGYRLWVRPTGALQSTH